MQYPHELARGHGKFFLFDDGAEPLFAEGYGGPGDLISLDGVGCGLVPWSLLLWPRIFQQGTQAKVIPIAFYFHGIHA
jgi:hypothetical protein